MAARLLVRRPFVPLLLAVVAAVTAGDVKPTAIRAQTQSRVEVTVNARRYEFVPARIDAVVGDIVKVTLVAEDIPHSFTVDAYRISKRAAPGQRVTFEFRVDQAGSFPFYCDLTIDDGCRHMKGTLVVAPRR